MSEWHVIGSKGMGEREYHFLGEKLVATYDPDGSVKVEPFAQMHRDVEKAWTDAREVFAKGDAATADDAQRLATIIGDLSQRSYWMEYKR